MALPPLRDPRQQRDDDLPPLRDPRTPRAGDAMPLPSESQSGLPANDDSPTGRALQAIDDIERVGRVERLRQMPSDSADRRRLARELGIDASNLTDVAEAERAALAQRLSKLAQENKAIARLIDEDPATGAVAPRDADKLTTADRFMRGAGEFLSKAPDRLYSGYVQSSAALWELLDGVQNAGDYVRLPFDYAAQTFVDVAGLPGAGEDPMDRLERKQEQRAERRAALRGQAERIREGAQSENFIVESALGGLEFAPISIAATLTRNPSVAAGLPAATVGAMTFREAREQGLTIDRALRYSILQGGTEFVTEKIPANTLVDAMLNKSPFGRTLFKTLASEIPGEQAATLIQDMADWAYLPENKGKTLSDFIGERGEAALGTLIGTVSGTTLQVGVARGIPRAMEVSMNLGTRFREARRAKAEGKFLDVVAEQFGAMELRKADPEAFAKMLREMGEERGVSTVLLDGEAARKYLQSDQFEGEADPLAPFAEDIEDAAMAGGDVALPFEVAVGVLPGTKAWAALKEDMRLSAGGETPREAQAFLDSAEEIEAEFNEQIGKRQEAEADATGKTEKAVARMQEKLEAAGYTPYQAEQEATRMVARMETRAARRGVADRDAAVQSAVENFPVVQRMPDELRRAMEADEADMVLAAVRGKIKGSTSRARAAAQELVAELERRGYAPADLSDEQIRDVIAALQETGETDGREYRDGNRGQRDGAGGQAPLAGAPKVSVGGVELHGPIPAVVAAAEAYAEKAGIALTRQAEYAPLDEEFAKRLADAYEAMEHAPGDPAVAEAYKALIEQTRAQYDALVEAGFTFTFFDDASDPYNGKPWRAMRDLRENSHLAVYSTAAGFGTDQTFDPTGNPLLAPVMVASSAQTIENEVVLSEQDGAVVATLADGREIVFRVVQRGEGGQFEVVREDRGEVTQRFAGGGMREAAVGKAIPTAEQAMKIARSEANRTFEGRVRQGSVSDLSDDQIAEITAAMADGRQREDGGVQVTLKDDEKAALRSAGIEVGAGGVISAEDAATLDGERAAIINKTRGQTPLTWPDQNGVEQPVLANDLFRAVHDAFGHGIEGAGFRAQGEENAWQAHARLFTGPALAALTSETRGQNSWLNYGPHGDKNRDALLDDTTFGDQKTGLLPEWAWTENRVGDMGPAAPNFEGIEGEARDLGVGLDLRFEDGGIILDNIARQGGEKGAGAEVMRRLVEQADAAGLPIQLMVEGEAENTTLIDYYRQFGFELDGDADINPEGVMFREPRGATSERAYEQFVAEGEVAVATATGAEIGWTEQRLEDLLRNYGYASEPERTKAYAVRMSPDQFLGLTASAKGRKVIAERVEGEEYDGGEIDFDRMRGETQTPFLVVSMEGGKIGVNTTIPESLRVMGHEGRHRMTMLKRAGIESVPVVVMLRDPKKPPTDSNMKVSGQRSRSDQLSTGDTPTEIEGLEPISYANRERLKEVFGRGRELFQPAYHGSPHIFDRFSLDRIGMGEGAQAYGWGLYFAGKKEVAEFYRNALSDKKFSLPDGTLVNAAGSREVERAIIEYTGLPDEQRTWDIASLIRTAIYTRESEDTWEDVAFQAGAQPYDAPDPSIYEEAEAIINRMAAEGAQLSAGRLYEVDIPEDNEFLLWDEPLSEQPEQVQQALRDAGFDFELDNPQASKYPDTGGDIYMRLSRRIHRENNGGVVALNGAREDKMASLTLLRHGIAGIKYLDGGSRSKGDGTYNYVVFDDSRINVRSYEQSEVFYSALERTIEQTKTARAPAQQWIATLKKAPGVKAEELEWTGVLDWLEIQNTPVERERLLEVVRRGGVVVSEVVLAPLTEEDLDPAVIDERVWDSDYLFHDWWEPTTTVIEVTEEDAEGEEIVRYAVANRGESTPISDDEIYDDEDEAQEAADRLDEEVRDEAYMEWESDQRREVIEAMLDDPYAENRVKWQGYSLSDRDDGSYRELLVTLPPGERGNPENAVSGTHWDEYEDEGVVAHARFFDAKGPNGEKILFLDEIQSDWHQMGRDQGYERKPAQADLDAAEEEVEKAREENNRALSALYDAATDLAEETRAAVMGQSGGKIIPGVIGDRDILAAARSERGQADPKIAAALARYEETDLAYDAAKDFLLAVESGADPEAYRKAKSAYAEAQQALWAQMEVARPVFARLRETLRPLFDKALDGERQIYEADLANNDLNFDQSDFDAAMNAQRQRLGHDTIYNASLNQPYMQSLLHVAAILSDTGDGLTAEAKEARERADIELGRVKQVKSTEQLREQELRNITNGGSIPDAPFKDSWPTLVMKRITAWAAEGGYDQVAWIKQGENNGGMNDDVEWFYGRNLPNMTNKFLKPHGVKVKPLRVQGRLAAPGGTPRLSEIASEIERLKGEEGGTQGFERFTSKEEAREQYEKATERLLADVKADRETNIPFHQGVIKAVEEAMERGDAMTTAPGLHYETQATEDTIRAHKSRIVEIERLIESRETLLNSARDFDALWERGQKVRELALEKEELDRTAPTNLGFDITPKLREAAAAGFPLFQPDHRNGARGRILFPGDTDEGAVIELFQSRNLSTLIHETSHLYLEELKADAAAPDASEQLKRDYQIVLDWFRDNGHEVRDGVIPVGAHEMWARAGERYVREGKAPSLRLQRAFDAFRSWLLDVYKTVRGLNAPITPEIRGVFDRLYATDAEIEMAREAQGLQALFDDLEKSGMTKGEFASYQEQVASARAEAQGSMLKRMMEDIRKRETRLYQQRKRDMREQVAAEVEDSPLFRALAIMRRERVDKAWIVENFGEDVLKDLPVRVPPIYSDRGVDPQIVAEKAGYDTASEMIEALVAVQAEQDAAHEGGDERNLKTRTIEQRVERRLDAEFGDPLTEEEIEREAIAAVNSEQQGEVLAAEIRALSRRNGKRPTPYRVAREWARTRVRQGTYANEASPSALQRHRRAVTRAGKEAELAFAKGDTEAALRAKQKQMLSSALLAEAKQAGDEVTRARKRMAMIAGKRTLKSVDQDYLEQAHALLEAVDLKERTQISLDRKGKWEEWATAREAEGKEIVVPKSFEAMIAGTNWSRLPVEQLLGLDEAVKQVIHFGRMKQRLLDNKDARDFEEVKGRVRAQAEKIGKKEPKSDFDVETWGQGLKSWALTADANLMKVETIFDILDDGDPEGVFNTFVFKPIAAAQARERDMLRDFYDRMKANFEQIDEKTLRSWPDKIDTGLIEPKVGKPWTPTREQVVAMALNWGNAGNRQRLADGYGFRQDRIEKLLMDTLTEQEWQFVQRTWDIIGELWPEIAALERRINGVEPEKVEAVQVQTPFGTLQGGYYPAIYNTKIDRKARQHLAESEDLFSAMTTKATTRASSAKERSEEVKRPILLDLGVINRHMGEVIHDITHREAILQADRLLSDPEVLDEVDAVLGREYSEQFRPWLKFIANRWAHDREGNEGFGRFSSRLRANATVVGMGLRFSTMMTQVAGFSNSIEYVGEAAFAKALAQTSAHPIETHNFVMEKSGEMRHRADTLDRDINKALRDMTQPKFKRKGKRVLTSAQEFAFHGIGYMDRVVSVPTWLAGYNKALERGASEEQAIYEGDKAVRLSQGAADAKDLAAIQRGTGKWGELLKWATMFYSYMSAFYQRQRRLGRDVRRAVGEGDIAAFPGLLARAWWLLVVPPILAELLAMRWPDDDEDLALWMTRKMIGQSLGPIPFARDMWEPLWARAFDEPSFGYRMSPATGAFESAINVGGDVGNIVEGEPTKRATRNALELVGYSTGLVPGQVAQATQFWVDVGYGEQNPRDAWEAFEGTTKGKIEE